MTTLPVSADGQAIALACSSLAMMGERSLKPLTATEWHELSVAMRTRDMRPRDLLGLSTGDLCDALGIGPPLAERLSALMSRGGQLAFEIERLSNRGIWILTRADDAYPGQLKQRLRQQAPPVFFGAGPQSALNLPAVAIVGSRDVDEEGLAYATALGARCATEGFAVASGGARGVDQAAMDGAIGRGGVAVGVTVDPLERLVHRRDLRAPIADELLTLVTPFHPSARWHAGNAMRRNRLIYTLAQAAVVVASSTDKGGTRSGALENLKSRWVPLHVRADGTPGNQKLIDDGGIPLPAELPVEELEVGRLITASSETLLAAADLNLVDQRPVIGERPTPQSVSVSSSPSPSTRELTEDSDATGGLFELVWPTLAGHLAEPLTEREFAERLQLELTQARAWLRRAAAEGRVEVRARPKRYVLRDVADRQLRIGDS